MRTKSRDLYDMRKGLVVEMMKLIHSVYLIINLTSTDDLNATSLIRIDIEGKNIDESLIGKRYLRCAYFV